MPCCDSGVNECFSVWHMPQNIHVVAKLLSHVNFKIVLFDVFHEFYLVRDSRFHLQSFATHQGEWFKSGCIQLQRRKINLLFLVRYRTEWVLDKHWISFQSRRVSVGWLHTIKTYVAMWWNIKDICLADEGLWIFKNDVWFEFFKWKLSVHVDDAVIFESSFGVVFTAHHRNVCPINDVRSEVDKQISIFRNWFIETPVRSWSIHNEQFINWSETSESLSGVLL